MTIQPRSSSLKKSKTIDEDNLALNIIKRLLCIKNGIIYGNYTCKKERRKDICINGEIVNIYSRKRKVTIDESKNIIIYI